MELHSAPISRICSEFTSADIKEAPWIDFKSRSPPPPQNPAKHSLDGAEHYWMRLGRIQGKTCKRKDKVIVDKRLKKMLQCLDFIDEENTQRYADTYLDLLRLHDGLLTQGKWVHACIIKNSHIHVLSVTLFTNLVILYAQSGSLLDLWHMFNSISNQNHVLWMKMISECVKFGHAKFVLQLFYMMKYNGKDEVHLTLIHILCASSQLAELGEGKLVHSHILNYGHQLNIFAESKLIDMYLKCGSIEDAHEVFVQAHTRNLVSWNVMIAGYAQLANGKQALELFNQMQKFMYPDNITLVCILVSCTNVSLMEQGKRIHSYIISRNHEVDIFVNNALIDMYAKCGSIQDARCAFDTMFVKDVVSWTSIIAGYVLHSDDEEAIKLFHWMQQESQKPNKITCICVVKACGRLRAIELGRYMHASVLKSGCEHDTFVGSALIDLYGKCGIIGTCFSIFNRMLTRSVVSWTTLISGCIQCGDASNALQLFKQMDSEGLKPNNVTLIAVMGACSQLASLQQGKLFHAHATSTGYKLDNFIGSTLVDMYAKCGSMDNAYLVFDRVPGQSLVTWNALIAGSVHQDGKHALEDFHEMQNDGVMPDNVTFIHLLHACSNMGALGQGKQVHAQIMLAGCGADILLSNMLIDMYAKCGTIEDAHELFNKLHKQDHVSWTAIIAGYVRHEDSLEALRIFNKMQEGNMEPRNFTFVVILRACAMVAALEQGKRLHAHVKKLGCETDLFIGTALMYMYIKCGSINNASEIFSQMPCRNIITWNALIAGCAQHGLGKEAVKLFVEMHHEGMMPDKVTFLSVITACSYAGLFDEGCYYFVCESENYEGIPLGRHYACIIGLLGRTGFLDEAHDFIKGMPLQHFSIAFLSNRCNVELAEGAIGDTTMLEHHITAALILLSNMNAAVGRPDDKARLRRMLRERYTMQSWVEVIDYIHDYIIEDTICYRVPAIYTELKTLMQEVGLIK